MEALTTFRNLPIGIYWFETGTPTYLVQLLQERDYDLEKMSREETTAEDQQIIRLGINFDSKTRNIDKVAGML